MQNPGQGTPRQRSTGPAASVENLQQQLLFHSHSGSGPLAGGQLYGPYFIVDQVNKKVYQIVCNNGLLSAVALT